MSNLIILILCSALNALGGYSFKAARRYILPVVLGIGLSLATKTWWVGLMILPTMGLLSIGYGEKSFLEHIFNDAWARFVWFALVCLGVGTGLFLTGHLAWYWFFTYVVVNATLGITIRKYNQIITDLIFGAAIASIVFLVR